MLQQRDSTTQGTVGMGAAIALYTARGYTISVPLVDSQSYDLLVDDSRSIRRVQIKTTRNYRDECFVVTLSSDKSKPFDRTKVDDLFVLTSMGDIYIIPAEVVGGEYQIVLSSKYDSYRICRYELPFADSENDATKSRAVKIEKLFCM